MKKLSKRLLSVLLSALLVITSLPLFAFSALAADTTAIDNAMAAYEAAMDGNFYTNMSAAYDAYVAAAAVKADENATAAQISSAASALTAATANMGAFSGYAANGTIAYGSGTNQPTGGASILWANGASDTAYDQSQGGKAETSTLGITYGAYFWYYYPTNTVLMYDGRTTPVLPIMMGALDKDKNYNLHPDFMFTNSTDFTLNDYWYGYDDNFGWPTSVTYKIGYNQSTGVGSIDNAVELDNESTVRSFRNYLTLAIQPTATLTTINGMKFYEQHYMNVVGTTQHTDENKELTMTIPVRVINYKKLLDKLGQVGGQYNSALSKVSDYKEGGLGDLIDAIDYASTDPNSFFTSTNNYQGCADWIDAAIAGFNDITVTMDPAAAQSVDGADDLLAAFETKVSSGRYYLNTLPVYELYCKLHATVDAYQYGDGTSEAIGIASEALATAMSNMVEFTPYTVSGRVKMQDDTNYITDSAYVSGINGDYTASTSTMGYDSLGGSGTSPGGVYAFVNSPTSLVAVYDGSTPIRFPVMTAWHNNMGFAIGTGNRRMMNAVYPIVYNDGNYTPADNADFGLTQAWQGHTRDSWNSNMSSTPNNVVFNWSSAKDSPAYVGTLAGYTQATYNASNTYSENYTWQGQRSSYIYAYWNYMQYKGGASGFSDGIKTVKINYWGMSKWPKAAIDTEGRHWFGNTTTPVTTVTIIDYKGAIDTFKANWDAKMATFAQGGYDEGGYASVFTAADAFTSYNGLSTATTASAAATVGSTLYSLANALGTATGTANGSEYQALRDKISWYPSAEKYVQGLADPTHWTAESWQDLIDAIDAAEAIMTALPSNAAYFYIGAAAAQAAATAIQTAYDNLQEAGILIDPALTAYLTLIDALEDYTYLASDLNTAAQLVSSLTTAIYDSGTFGDKVPATDANRAAIANEVSVFTQAYETLTAQTFDNATYQNYIEAARRGANDPDAINITQLNTDIATLESCALQTVNFPHYGDVIGLKANAQSAVDTAWAAVQTDLSTLMQYTVVVKDADGNTLSNVGEGTYAYGTEVTINAGTGNYTYDYVSNTSNTNASHKVKNIGTLDSFTFTVQGNTTITVGAPTNSKPVTVTYRANLAPIADGESATTFVIKKDYVASGTTITSADVNAPSYAFYSYQGFTQSTAANGDITVVLNYNYVGDAQQYEVYSDVTGESEYYYFNECVTLEFEDSPVIAAVYSMDDIDRFNSEESDGGIWQSNWDHLVDDIEPFADLLGYGDTYTFRVKEDIYFLWLDQGPEFYGPIFKNTAVEDGDYIGFTSSNFTQSITGGKQIITYNSFALPEGCTFVEAGLLFHYNKSGDTLLDREITLGEAGSANDMGNDKIRRNKATKVDEDEGCRFTINASLTNCSAPTAEYVVYLNYKKNGVLHTVYSEVNDVNF